MSKDIEGVSWVGGGPIGVLGIQEREIALKIIPIFDANFSKLQF